MEPLSRSDAEAVRRAASEIVSRPEYNLQKGTSDDSWLYSLLLEIIDWILVPLRWLFDIMKGLPDFLWWTIVLGLATVAILLVAHIAYSLVTALRKPKRLQEFELTSRRRTIDPEEFDRLALEAARRADYITAIRFLFKASVARLELTEKRPNRPGTTNRDLLRRYRNKPLLSEPLKQLVDTIDRKWYGDEVCTDADFAFCQTAHGNLTQAIKEPAHAVRA